MPSVIPDSYFEDVQKGKILPETDTIKVMILSNAATPTKAWAKRSDVTNEITGTNYTAGGTTVTCTVAKDTVNHRVDLTLGGTVFANATMTGRYAVYYKSRGGAANLDEILFINDFGADVSSTGASWTLNASTLRASNPN